MTMTKDQMTPVPGDAFWLNHPDPTQAAAHLALQWLAYVYPASELQIDRTLKSALPYADADLSSRWSQFLDEKDVEDHVQALEWIAKTLSNEQIPFLVETCWRLLLVDHELPNHTPLALRILGRVLSLSEGQMLSIGESVAREYADEDQNRVPLLPVDPRYLDRIEWRLYGATATSRLNVSSEKSKPKRSRSGLIGFAWGSLFGVAFMAFLVFGPLQLGRVKVPIMLHDGLLLEEQAGQPTLVTTAPEVTPSAAESSVSEPVSAEPVVVDAETESESIAEDITPAVAELIDDAIQQTTDSTAEPEPISETVIAEPDVPARVLMEVTASILNVRAEANVNSDIIIKLAVGARVWAYPGEATGLWMMVRVEGQEGFASARFLQEVDL